MGVLIEYTIKIDGIELRKEVSIPRADLDWFKEKYNAKELGASKPKQEKKK